MMHCDAWQNLPLVCSQPSVALFDFESNGNCVMSFHWQKFEKYRQSKDIHWKLDPQFSNEGPKKLDRYRSSWNKATFFWKRFSPLNCTYTRFLKCLAQQQLKKKTGNRLHPHSPILEPQHCEVLIISMYMTTFRDEGWLMSSGFHTHTIYWLITSFLYARLKNETYYAVAMSVRPSVCLL